LTQLNSDLFIIIFKKKKKKVTQLSGLTSLGQPNIVAHLESCDPEAQPISVVHQDLKTIGSCGV
jgi:hypothetical protein